MRLYFGCAVRGTAPCARSRGLSDRWRPAGSSTSTTGDDVVGGSSKIMLRPDALGVEDRGPKERSNVTGQLVDLAYRMLFRNDEIATVRRSLDSCYRSMAIYIAPTCS